MGSPINFGSRKFGTKAQGQPFSPVEKKKLFNVAAQYSALTGAGLLNLGFTIFSSLLLPNSCFLKRIIINGTFLDTAASGPKATQPLVELTLFQFGLAGSLNNQVPSYTLGANSTIDPTVFITGKLNEMVIEFNSELYISGQTQLVLTGIAYFYAATLATDSLIINARLVFEE